VAPENTGRISKGGENMPGQAVVTIKDRQWFVGLASTYAELAQGLSGISSIPSGTGILFDMGVDQGYVQINMSRMLFALDIIFINSSAGVVGVMHEVQPNERDVIFDHASGPGARYFLEVTAGEAESIEDGDDVVIQGTIPSTASQTIVNALITAGIMIPVVAGVAGGLTAVAGSKETPPKNAGKWKF
jgi:uncharacterized membrane protein (UPF0127 family)